MANGPDTSPVQSQIIAATADMILGSSDDDLLPGAGGCHCLHRAAGGCVTDLRPVLHTILTVFGRTGLVIRIRRIYDPVSQVLRRTEIRLRGVAPDTGRPTEWIAECARTARAEGGSQRAVR
ncbi:MULTISPECIES: hypothetical protein [unclassified Kitasatospora]|uniref:hypothetical protein n=1 Tax=unclassified Kitasatospora TaxID=2633591 RepID=UPI00380CF638